MSLLLFFRPQTASAWPKPLTLASGRRKVWSSGAVLELTSTGRVRLVASSTRKVSIAQNGRLTAPADASLRAQIMADSPTYYYRLNDVSGTSAANETGGAAGTYVNTPVLNQPAIYAGGPVCVYMQATNQSMVIPAASLAATSTLTLGIVIKPSNVGVGVQAILSKDPNSGREWQWRMNNATLEWVKTNAGVETHTATGVFANNVACMVHVVINGTSITMYKNGVSVYSGTIASYAYGTLTSDMAVGFQTGPATGLFEVYVSEAFCCSTALSAARVLAHAQAAGF